MYLTRKKLFAICSIVFLCAICVFWACDCRNNPSDQVVAGKPEIIVSDEGITWTKVEDAKAYEFQINDGEWTKTDKQKCDFPSSVGKYVIKIAAIMENGEKGISIFSFSVAEHIVSATRTENTNIVVFHGENIMYKVGNETGFHSLGDKTSLDFSAMPIGTEVTITYYSEGKNTWIEKDAVYYIDSGKKQTSFTVIQKLESPILTLNEAKDGLVWPEVVGASAYNCVIDGVVTEIGVTAERIVKFPTVDGNHTIKVQAVGNDNDIYSSDFMEYSMKTVKLTAPQIQFNSESMQANWISDITPYIQTKTDSGTWQNVSSSFVAYSDGLQIKSLAYYNETTKTYYTESLPYCFATRETPVLAFDKSGVISWNAEDTGSALNYELVKDSSKSITLQINVIDVRDYAVGNHSISIKGLEYTCVSADATTFYFESDSAEINFKTQSTPSIGYQAGRITWKAAKGVEGYEVKKGNGSWVQTTAVNYTLIDGDGTYYVRALGCDDANAEDLIVTSKETVIYLTDTKYPTKDEFVDYDVLDFSADKDLAFLPLKDAVDKDNIAYDESEQALLVSNTDHQHCIYINYPSVRLVKGDYITLTMKVVKTEDKNPNSIDDGGLELNGGQVFWKDVMTEEYRAARFGGGNNPDYMRYCVYTYTVTNDEFFLTNIKWRPYGNDLISVYIKNITINRPWAVAEEDYKAIDFGAMQAGTEQPKQFNRNGIVENLAGYGKALKTSVGHNGWPYNENGLKFDYSDSPITLNAGDTVTANFYAMTSSVVLRLHFDGSANFSKELFVEGKGKNTITYVHSGASVELTKIGFATWSFDGESGVVDKDELGYDRVVFYLKSVVVTNYKLKSIDWQETDNGSSITYSVDFSKWGEYDACGNITYNDNAAFITQADVGGKTKNVLCTGINTNVMKTYFDFSDLDLSGKQITFKMIMKLPIATNNSTSCDIYVGKSWTTGNYNGQWMTTEWKTISETFTVANGDTWTLCRQGGADYAWDQQMYIASIEIVVPK